MLFGIMKNRLLQIPLENNAFFLWGPRKVGKSTYLRHCFPHATYYDLLDTRLRMRLELAPYHLREEILGQRPELVIIDEIQQIPALLNEVHWCLENTKTCFIMCGSSARKLRHGAANLLGGRAWRYEMFPLTSQEIGDFSLLRALNHGCLPQHYESNTPERFLESYVLDYIDQEIRAEALVRNVAIFSRFLELVAVTNTELLNYENIARECGVSAKTVSAYYQILEDTLLGFRLPPWHKRKKKPLIEAHKFYLFDTGIVRALHQMNRIQPKTQEFGKAFEHLMINETRAFLSYSKRYEALSFWRTRTHDEIDLIIGDMQCAIEFKAKEGVGLQDAKGFDRLAEEFSPSTRLIVSLDTSERLLSNGVLVLPWQIFLKRLWAGKILPTEPAE